ncbi:MAG TPA: hypothetical protein VEF89_12860 [Solirubrobacteraceae bacterium]|nr:hypothetical protein [Solirubrobacteraceae bacterium]
MIRPASALIRGIRPRALVSEVGSGPGRSAHPDVVGVAAVNRRGNAPAYFSNWGSWLACCTRGQYVLSTYIHWFGPLEWVPVTTINDATLTIAPVGLPCLHLG